MDPENSVKKTCCCCKWPMLTAVRGIFIYDCIALGIDVLLLIADLVFEQYGSFGLRLFGALSITVPRIIIEAIFMKQNYTEIWAYRCYVTRIVTTIIFIVIILVIILAIALEDDEGWEIAVGISLTVIIYGIFVLLDLYFALMYKYYWQHPHLRVDRKGLGPDGEPVQAHENGNNELPPNHIQDNTQNVTYLQTRQGMNETSMPVNTHNDHRDVNDIEMTDKQQM